MTALAPSLRPARHRWGPPDRRDAHRTERRCEHCFVVKVTRHEGGRHWQQYERRGAVIARAGEAAPPCGREKRLRPGGAPAAQEVRSLEAPGDAFGLYSDGPVHDCRGNVADWMKRYVVCADRADRLDGHSFTKHATDLVYRAGKKRAGRTLDGVVHDGFPERGASRAPSSPALPPQGGKGDASEARP